MRSTVSGSAWLFVVIFGCALTIPFASDSLAAQSGATASIVGKVSDESGGAMPGVTVTASGPALQVPQLGTVTDAEGNYRIMNLPAGAYRVVYELSGFQTVIQEDVRLSVGLVGRVDAVLKVGGLSESITVSGHSPVVDTVNTTSSTTFQREILESTPKGRGMWEVYNLASGVSSSATDVGDSNIGTRGDVLTYGVAAQMTVLIEGINGVTFDGPGFSSAQYIDYFPMEEIQVNASGNSPDIGTPGVGVTVVMKSGGNTFHGNYEAAGQHPRLQGNNITDELKAQGLSVTLPLKYYYDYAGDLGGRILRDQLWFYGGITRQESRIGIAGFSKSPGPDGLYLTLDDEPGTRAIALNDKFLKLSAQVTPKAKLIGSAIFWSKQADHWTAARPRPAESTTVQDLPGLVWKGELQYVPSNTVVINALGGWAGYTVKYDAQPGTDVKGNPSRFEQSTSLWTGPNALPATRPASRYEARGSISYLPNGDFLGGQHQLKVGGIGSWEMGATGNRVMNYGAYTLRYLNSVPNQILTYNTPFTPSNNLETQAVYAHDRWSVGRLTMNLGVRWERYDAFYPDQQKEAGPFSTALDVPYTRVILWTKVVPRLGVAWDLFGNGKTVLKSTYGMYGNQPGYNFAENFNPNALVTTTWRWRDLNGNNDYDPGETNLDPTESDYIRATGGANRVLNLDLKQPMTNEFVAKLERELVAYTAVSVTYVFKKIYDQFDTAGRTINRPYDAFTIPVQRVDPGPDGTVGNADDGGPVTIWTYPATMTGPVFNRLQMVNAPRERDDRYHTIETTFTKRYSSRWNMLTSFWVTKNHRWIAASPVNPNDDPFPVDDTWTWEARLTASYTLPYDVSLSGTVRSEAGDPGQRTVVFGTIPQLSSVTMRMEPFGAQRGPAVTLVNLRSAKKFSVGGNRKLEARFELFNAFNASAATTSTYQSGRAFGFATGLLAPRIARFGVAYSF